MTVNRPHYQRRALAVIAAALSYAASRSAEAIILPILPPTYWATNGTGTWDTTTPNWSTTSSGGPTSTWTNGRTAYFASSTVTTTSPYGVSLGNTAITALSLSFETGNVAILPGGSGTLALSGPTIDVAGGADGTIAANFTSSTGLVKSGTGNLTLAGSNSISGPISIQGGTLNANSVGALGAGGFTVTSAGTLNANWSGTNTVGGNISNSGNFTVAAGATLGLPSGFGFTQSSGTLAISGAMTMAGSTFTDNGGALTGTVTLDNSSAVPTLSIGAGATSGSFLFTGTSTSSPGWNLSGSSVPSGVSLTVTPTNSSGSAYPLTTSGSLSNAGSITLNGNSAQGGGLSLGNLSSNTLTNTGTLVINTYTGNNTGYGALYGGLANSGTTSVGAVQTVISGNVSNSGTFTIASGGTLGLGNGATFTQSAGTMTVNGTMSNNAAFNIGGGTLTGAGSIQAGVQLSAGILTSGATPLSTTGTLTLTSLNVTGGNVQFDIGASSSNTIQVDGPVTYGGGGVSLLLGGSPTNGAQFTVLNSTLPLPTSGLSLTPTTLGRTTLTPSISGHNLIVTASIAPGSLTWNNTGGTGDGVTWDVQNNQNWNSGSPDVFYQGDAVNFNDANNGHYAVTLNSVVSPSSTMFANISSDYTISGSGSIGGSGGLTLNGSRTVTLSTLNTYSGSTTINGGSLYTGVSNALPSTTAVTIGASGGLNIAGEAITIASISGSGPTQLSSGTLTVSGAASTNYSGVISDLNNGGSLVKAGSGTLTLGGVNTFTGPLKVNSGMLVAGIAGAFPTGADLVVNNSATVDLSGYSQTVASLSSGVGASSTVTNSGTAATLTFNFPSSYASSGLNYYGTISGNLSLVKSGPGAEQLFSANSYSGSTTINGGTITVGATNAIPATSDVTVGPAGVLNLSGNNTTIASLSGSGIVTFSSGTLTVNTSGRQTFSGLLGNGSGGFTMAGTGTEILNGNGSFLAMGNTNMTGPLTVTSGILQVATNLTPSSINVGSSAGAIVNQTAGTINASAYVDIARYSNMSATYNLSGGALNAATDLTIGYDATTTGIFDLSGTGTSLSETETEYVNGTFNQLGTTSNTAGQLAIGFEPSTSGVYNLYTGTLSTGPGENLGYQGNSVFNQSGGTHTAAGEVFISAADGCTSIYNLSAGSLQLTGTMNPGSLYIGGTGTGVASFVQTGGSVSIEGALDLSHYVGNSSYSLSGTGTLSASSEYIGDAGSGTFTQGSGTTNTAEFMDIAANPYSNGVYNMNGGSLHITGGANPNLYVGDYWTGAFKQTGGSVVVDGGLYISRSADGGGSYSLSGVSSTLSATLEEVGGFAPGTFTQMGGTNTATALEMGAAGAGGTYNMEGGNLSVTTLYVGGNASQSYGPGTLAITGGTTSVTGASTVWNGGTLSIIGGTLSLTGPSASLSSATPIVLGLNGTLQLDNRTSSGGNSTVPTGRLSDSTNIELTGGTFSYLGADNTASTETLGALEIISGASTVSLVNGANGTTAVTFSGGLSRGAGTGATVNFAASNLGSTNQVFLTGQSPGFIGGWATVDNGPGGDANFASYNTTGMLMGVVAMTTYSGTFGLGVDARFSASPAPIAGNTSVATLSFDSRSAAVTVTQTGAGATLSLSQGGLLALGSNQSLLTGGALDSSRSDGEIDAYVQGSASLEVDSQIVNGSTSTSLVKSGPGLMTLGGSSPNTFSGTTYVQQGELDLNKSGGAFAINGPLVITGGTLVQLQPGQLGPNSSMNVASGTVTLGPTAISIGSYTINGGQVSAAGQWTVTTASLNGGQTVTLNGSVWTIGGNGPMIRPLAADSVLDVSGGTTHVGAGSSTIVEGSTTFLGNTGPTLQVDVGSSAVGAGTAGSPAGAGLLKLQGDVFVTSTAGVAGIITGTVGAGQTPGVVDLNGVIRTFSLASSGTFEISAQVTDGGINVSGSGMMELMATNTYAMGTTLSGGTLMATSSAALGSGPVTFAGGSLALRSDSITATFSEPLITNPSGSISLDLGPVTPSNTTPCSFTMGAGTFGVAMNLTGTAGASLTLPSIVLQNSSGSPTSIHNSANMIVNGPITMAQGASDGDILKDQAGTLTFEGSSANTYTGTTTVSGGMLVLDKSTGIDAVPHDLDVFGGGTVELLANGQIDTGSHITLDAVPSAAVLDLHGFNNTIGNAAGSVFLSFVAGGTLMTGTGTATLGGDVQFTGTSGTASISGNLSLGTAARTFTIARGSSPMDMQISAIIGGGPASGTAFTKTGLGILDLTGVNTYPGDTVVNQGTLTVDYGASLTGVNLTASAGTANINGSIPANTNLTVNTSGVAKFGASQNGGILVHNLAAINLSSNGQVVVADPGAGAGNHANRSVLVTSALSITNSNNAWQGLVNLNGNDMIVHNGSVPNISSQLKAGFNSPSGYWNGTAGIISTTAATNPTHLTTLGYRTGGSTFDGLGTSSTDVLIKYTYYGDANLDGTVNGADYQQIDNGFGEHLTGWANGDFNYDGFVDGSDFSLIDNSFNQLIGSGASPLALSAVASDLIAGPSSVPEPTTMALLGVATLGMCARRHRRR